MPVGLDQINVATPLWVKIVYRITFVFTTALAVWIAATHLLSTEAKFEWILVLKVIDPIFYYIGQLIGVKTEESSLPPEQQEFYKGVK